MSTNLTAGKALFGMTKDSNRNWIALISELSVWRQNNRDIPWPQPQEYVNTINSKWSQFKTNDFYYRYKKAQKIVDDKLGSEYHLQKIFVVD